MFGIKVDIFFYVIVIVFGKFGYVEGEVVFICVLVRYNVV